MPVALRTVALLVAAMVVLLGGCQVDTTVGVTVAEDGSGAVTVVVSLDEAAARRARPLELATDDLEQAGWEIDGPTDMEGGGLSITASRPFAHPDEGAAIVEQLVTNEGVIGDVAIAVDRGRLRTTSRFAATVDLTGGLAAFSDAGLAGVLGGRPLGATEDELERLAGRPLEEAFQFEVAVDLPGNEAGAARWSVPLGDRARLETQAADVDELRVAAAVVAAAAVCGLAVLAFLALRRRRLVSLG